MPGELLRIGHSPDPDDAFMWWPLFGEQAASITTGRFRYEGVERDIESLNRDSESGELDITAISCAQYPFIAGTHAITSCGASMGDHYGPKIVAREALTTEDLSAPDVQVAVPGLRTSAVAAARILLGRDSFRGVEVPFDEIIPRVLAGEFAAGLVIHEGQLTFAESGLHHVADLGMLWASRCGLPLPLGVNTVRRDLDERFGRGSLQAVVTDLVSSIRFAMAHRAEALAVARRYAHGTSDEQTEQFCDMYVNRWTVDLGTVGAAAITTLLAEAHRAGLCPDVGTPDIIAPAGREVARVSLPPRG